MKGFEHIHRAAGGVPPESQPGAGWPMHCGRPMMFCLSQLTEFGGGEVYRSSYYLCVVCTERRPPRVFHVEHSESPDG